LLFVLISLLVYSSILPPENISDESIEWMLIKKFSDSFNQQKIPAIVGQRLDLLLELENHLELNDTIQLNTTQVPYVIRVSLPKEIVFHNGDFSSDNDELVYSGNVSRSTSVLLRLTIIPTSRGVFSVKASLQSSKSTRDFQPAVINYEFRTVSVCADSTLASAQEMCSKLQTTNGESRNLLNTTE
jgi:hypothetical protein